MSLGVCMKRTAVSLDGVLISLDPGLSLCVLSCLCPNTDFCDLSLSLLPVLVSLSFAGRPLLQSLWTWNQPNIFSGLFNHLALGELNIHIYPPPVLQAIFVAANDWGTVSFFQASFIT